LFTHSLRATIVWMRPPAQRRTARVCLGAVLVLATIPGCDLIVPLKARDRSALESGSAADLASPDRRPELAVVQPDLPQSFGGVTKVGDGVISTSATEDDPTLTGDMLELCFERDRDIFCATRTSLASPWSAAQAVAELNTSEEEGTPELAPDGKTIYLSSARGSTAVHVFVSTRAGPGQAWSAPVPVTELSSPASDNCAAISGDGLTIAIDSERATSGDRDLFLASRAGPWAPWGNPAPVTELNTVGHEDSSPWLDQAARVIYFASDRGGNMDLWVATRPDRATSFSAPSPVSGLCSSDSEADPWLSPDQRTIYFARNAGGNWDLYTATR
jgi:hypothetical protein